MSMMKMLAAAEKLSTPQLQQAVKDGSIPSYIGIPMIQDRTQREAKYKAAQAAQAPKRPPIADQVMAQAAQAEQQQAGVEQLPSGLPQNYALGGIVAFENGGDVDQTYQDYLDAQDLERDDEIMDRMMDRMDVNATPKTGIASAPSMSYSQVQGQAPRAARQQDKVGGTGHKYESMVLEEAKRQGVDPRLALHVLNKETGNLKNPESAKSPAGALGVMQLMPATAKYLGVKDPLNAEENIRGGIKYLAELSNQFKDPRLVAAAYNAGPGNVRKYGDVPPFKETQGYVQGLAEGGIAHFYQGGGPNDVTSEDERSRLDIFGDWLKEKGNAIYEMPSKAVQGVTEYFTTPPNRGQGTLKGLSDKEIAQLQAEGTENATYNWPSRSIGSYQGYPTAEAAIAARDKNLPAKPAPAAPAAPTAPATPAAPTAPTATTAPAAAPESPYDAILKDIMANREERKKGKEQDKWMSVLTAGLGMLGSQSPYANVGIGQGAMAGVAQYGALRKQAASEEAADLKSLLTARHYQQAEDLAREKLAAAQAAGAETRGLTAEAQRERAIATGLQVMNNFKQQYMSRYNKLVEGEFDQEKKAQIIAQAEASMYQDPEYKALHEKFMPGVPIPSFSGSVQMPQGVTVTRTSK